jgi:hypothetical protein
MRLFLIALALAMAATGARAETTACTAIGALPYVITTPGKYCLTANLSHTAVVGDEIGIFVNSASDVELDCNDFRLTGTRITTPEMQLTHDQYTAIYVGSSSRVVVRNCRISGWSHGIQVHRAGSGGGFPRSRDVEIADNVIEGSWKGILAFPEGDSRIHGNVISNALAYGFWINAPPGQLRMYDNAVLSTGDTTTWLGQGANLRSDLGGWLIFEHNLIAETASPAAAAGAPAVDLPGGGGIGIAFVGNKVFAPAVAGRKGSVTNAVNNPIATYCADNVFIGYGALPANCTDPSNQAY